MVAEELQAGVMRPDQSSPERHVLSDGMQRLRLLLGTYVGVRRIWIYHRCLEGRAVVEVSEALGR